MNTLTQRLLAEGYTKDAHPDYVAWTNWKHFEYTREYLAQSVWETPCGLLKRGMDYNHGSHLGVDYCPENDNPRVGCPFYDAIPCPHRFPGKLWGWNCAVRQTKRAYDYEQSMDKLWDAHDKIQSAAWQRSTAKYGYCACMSWDRDALRYIPRYNVDNCMNANCKNEVCAITQKPRNLEKVNIYYDVLRHWHYKKGLIEYHDRKIEKGVKKFKKAVARTDAEAWLAQNTEEFPLRVSRDDHRDAYFSEHHGEEGFGDYDFFRFEAAAQNIRIERRESRDLAQDLADIADGLEVVHESDKVKRLALEKRERKVRRQDAKNRSREKEKIENWLAIVNDESQDEQLRTFCRRKLAERGISCAKTAHEPEQISMFG